MNEKKKLEVDAMICDLRNVTEETLQQYESISIDAMTIYVTARSQELLHRYNVQMDAMSIEKMEEDEEIVTKNGSYTIKPGQESAVKVNLTVNGSLTVEKGSNEALKSYSKITVNGNVIYPRSAADALAPILHVNGREFAYPDEEGTVFLAGTAMIDRTFLARAKENTLYYIENKAIFMDEKADYGKLKSKNVTIEVPNALMTEAALEAVGECLNEKAKVELIPDGCIYVKENVELDDAFADRFGSRVYVNGNLLVKNAAALSDVEYLQVKGMAAVPEQDKKAFLNVCKEYGKLISYRGRLIADRNVFEVNREILMEAEEGLSIVKCVTVEIADDVDAELAKERLHISDCVTVRCSSALYTTVSLLAKDCTKIQKNEEEAENEEQGTDTDTLVIDAMTYKM